MHYLIDYDPSNLRSANILKQTKSKKQKIQLPVEGVLVKDWVVEAGIEWRSRTCFRRRHLRRSIRSQKSMLLLSRCEFEKEHSSFQIRNSSSSSLFVLSLHVVVRLTVQIGLDRMERRGYGAATWTTSSRFLFENIVLIFPRQAKLCVLTCSM